MGDKGSIECFKKFWEVHEANIHKPLQEATSLDEIAWNKNYNGVKKKKPAAHTFLPESSHIDITLWLSIPVFFDEKTSLEKSCALVFTLFACRLLLRLGALAEGQFKLILCS